MIFTTGDYLAGMLVGVVTALFVRIVVWPGMDMIFPRQGIVNEMAVTQRQMWLLPSS